MSCSVGIIVKEKCELDPCEDYSEPLHFCDLSAQDQNILKLRLKCTSLTEICLFHKKKYLDRYNHLFGRVCCDPFDHHLKRKKKGNKGCREINLDQYNRCEKKYQDILIPGKSLCPNCYNKIFSNSGKLPDNTTNEEECDDSDNDYVIFPDDSLNEVDAACSALGVPSVSSMVSRVSYKRKASELVKAEQRVSEELHRKISSILPQVDVNEHQPVNGTSLCRDYEILIKKLKEKCKVSNNEEKIKIISLMPSSWSRAQIVSELQVSNYLVNKSRELSKKAGVLPEVPKTKRKINEDLLKKVEDFYEADENSRLCPGKKDCVSISPFEGSAIAEAEDIGSPCELPLIKTKISCHSQD